MRSPSRGRTASRWAWAASPPTPSRQRSTPACPSTTGATSLWFPDSGDCRTCWWSTTTCRRVPPELIALARSRPGGRQLSYASAGAGTTLHLSGAMFAQTIGAPMLHVPYRGGAPAMVDVIAGRVDMIFDNIPGALAQARQGKVRPLAVTGRERNATAPDIPAVAEHLPGFEIVSWTCLSAPAGLPMGMAARMNALTRQALAGEELRRSFEDLGATPWWTTQEDLEAYRAAQEAALRPLILASGARVE
ncbi:MAG TPA: tripartite tricarboxylate transporter substrate binding protein [Acetobacteraceae bacterium]|nr:tripartite tricarboxylate transporter substrate binding protein [Acetobacteraceae bacterium]